MATPITMRDYVSQIRSLMKLNSADYTISDRAIAAIVSEVNIKYILQRLDRRESWISNTLFTTLPCICMEEADIVECCDVATSCKISKSVEKLPLIANSKYNTIIQGVWSLDKKLRYKECPPNRYSNYLKLGIHKKEYFFWLGDNGHLYVTDPNIEKVSISALFLEPIDTNQFECTLDPNPCPSNPLDLELKTLPKIADDIINETLNKIAQTYSKLVNDAVDDDKENK